MAPSMPPIQTTTENVNRYRLGRGRRVCKRVDVWAAPACEPYWMWGDYHLDVDFVKTSTWYLQDGSVHDSETSHPSPSAPTTSKALPGRYLVIRFGGEKHGVHEVVAYFHANHRGLSWDALKTSLSSIRKRDGEKARVKRYHVHHAGKDQGKPDIFNNLRSSLQILPFREHERLTLADRRSR